MLAVRVAVEVGKRFGVGFEALPVDIAVMNGRARDLMRHAIPVSQWDVFALSVGAVCSENGWTGHLIVGTDDLLCDVTAGQFANPDRHLHIGPWMLPRPPVDPPAGAGPAEWLTGGQVQWEWPLTEPGGGCMLISPHLEDRSYRQSADWQSNFRPLARVATQIILDGERLRVAESERVEQ